MPLRNPEQIPAEFDPFLALLKTLTPTHILEIGVRGGGTAAEWCRQARTRVIGVDVDENPMDVDEQAIFHHYRHIQGDSHDAATWQQVVHLLDGQRVDLLFLDGDHSYAGVSQDYQMYAPLVRPGGLIACHDIVDTELIRRAGHGVYQFWAERRAELGVFTTEFCVRAEWGGIGVLKV